MPSTYLGNDLVVLSPQGKLLETVSLMDAIQKSDYRLTLYPPPDKTETALPVPSGDPYGPVMPKRPKLKGVPPRPDPIHCKGVKLLTHAVAPKFSQQFKEGQVLVTLRGPSVLAVVDLTARQAVWAARGVWELPRRAQFLATGELEVVDRFGSETDWRILRYNPATQAITYRQHLVTMPTTQGVSVGEVAQCLPKNNVLVISSDGLNVAELNSANRPLWSWSHPKAPRIPVAPAQAPKDLPRLTSAVRYAPSALTFLAAPK